jgi:phage-related protein
MQVVALASVRDFLEALDPPLRPRAYKLIKLLEEYGHNLSMPVAKPVGGGLWELRSHKQPAMRILYGFCNGQAVLVHALKKQRSALLRSEIKIARKRFAEYCS